MNLSKRSTNWNSRCVPFLLTSPWSLSFLTIGAHTHFKNLVAGCGIESRAKAAFTVSKFVSPFEAWVTTKALGTVAGRIRDAGRHLASRLLVVTSSPRHLLFATGHGVLVCAPQAAIRYGRTGQTGRPAIATPKWRRIVPAAFAGGVREVRRYGVVQQRYDCQRRALRVLVNAVGLVMPQSRDACQRPFLPSNS